MKISQKTIKALVDLEAHYCYAPESISDKRDAAFDALLEAEMEPLIDLLNHMEDHQNGAELGEAASRLVRYTLDCYAPRRSVLDFDGPTPEVASPATFAHSFHPSGGPTQTVTTVSDSADELRHLRNLVGAIQQFVPALQLTDTDFEVRA